MRESLIVTLRVTHWAFSLGGQHFTGSVHGCDSAGNYKSVNVTHTLTAKQALALNKKDQTAAWCRHRPGAKSERFDTRAQLERRASKDFKKWFAGAVVLNVGQPSVAHAQRVLVGPDWFKDAANLIREKHDKAGGYEGDAKACHKLFQEYRALVSELESKTAV